LAEKEDEMKIALATNQKGLLTDQIAEHFGQSKKFLIYDSQIKKFTVHPNPELASDFELPPDFLHRLKVNIVIAFGLGPKAYEKFSVYNIKMHKAFKGTIAENISAFEQNKLLKLNQEDIF
jgi:predicted Fe-Mo cluster-binding NifX family protein